MRSSDSWGIRSCKRHRISYGTIMNLKLTAVFRKFPEGYAAFVEELPGANSQGTTLDEARANLTEAVEMVLAANRELAEEELLGQDVIREPFGLRIS
jgi:predicted RNase H-like HicB family nuclease